LDPNRLLRALSRPQYPPKAAASNLRG
jgi:hypothetical protein